MLHKIKENSCFCISFVSVYLGYVPMFNVLLQHSILIMVEVEAFCLQSIIWSDQKEQKGHDETANRLRAETSIFISERPILFLNYKSVFYPTSPAYIVSLTITRSPWRPYAVTNTTRSYGLYYPQGHCVGFDVFLSFLIRFYRWFNESLLLKFIT